ncbi:MAG: peptidoglycan DD-metalloendopeptidase family protein [Candidatus Binatia bacterium]
MSDPISAASVFVPQTPTGDETRRRLSGKSPKDVAKEFEAVLLAQVISAMRKTVPESGLLEQSANRKMLDGAFDQEVARSLAARGGLGIAKQIIGQIERQQGLQPAAHVASRESQAVSATGASTAASATAAANTVPSFGRSAVASSRAESVTPAVGSSVSVLPVEGEVTSPFGMRSDPFTGEPRFHGGVDVAAPRGSEICTVADGEVVFSGWRRGGSGRTVEVRHADGLVTSYAHAEKTLVRAGQQVVAGDVVATVGSTGRSSGPHLHFAATRDGQTIDPSGLLEHGQPVGPVAQASTGGL